MCNNTTLTGGGEDEYYSMVPEDNTVLDNSLSSSLSSLYRSAQGVEGVKNAEVHVYTCYRVDIVNLFIRCIRRTMRCKIWAQPAELPW